MADTTVEEQKPQVPIQRWTRKPRRSPARIIVPIVLLLLIAGGVFLWRYFGTYESTDDAR